MRLAVRPLKRLFCAGLLALGSLSLAGSALADYTGPDRVVSTFSWERLVCDYQVTYDPPGPGWSGCSLTRYAPPDGSCPSPWPYFTSGSCGWSVSSFCPGPYCDLDESDSIDSCRSGEEGCRKVENQTTLPEATVSGSLSCGSPGSGGWCRGGASLSISSNEPVAGQSIFLIEGTHNGTPFACDGASCSLPLVEGGNDFSFWAHSTFGDTSRMDSASGLLDSGDPSLSGSVSGTGGDNGWFVSSVTITASASDAVSGLASLDVKVDGGGWASYGGPVTLGDGSHDVDLRAVDVAGNTANQNLSVDVDTVDPFADLDAVPSFCPGCGQTLGITVIVQDGGSGIVDWDLTAGGSGVASGGSAVNQTVVWDGGGLGGGLHTLVLEASDRAGNEAGASFSVNLILPTPTPTDPPTSTPVPTATSEPPSLFSLFSEPTSTSTPPPGASPTPVRSPTSTRTPLTISFGGPPAAPLGPGVDDGSSEGPITNLQSPSIGPSSAVNSLPPGVYYGGAALALGAAAAAYAADQRRRRKEEEARQQAEMARANADAEAAEKARVQAIAKAREEAEEAEWKEILLGIIGISTAARLFAPKDDEDEPPRPGSLEWKERMLEPVIPPRAPVKPPSRTAINEQEGKPRESSVAPNVNKTTSLGKELRKIPYAALRPPTPPPSTLTPAPELQPTLDLESVSSLPLPTATPSPIFTQTPTPSGTRMAEEEARRFGQSTEFPPPGFRDPREMTPLFSIGAGMPIRVPRVRFGPLVEWGDAYNMAIESSAQSPVEGGARARITDEGSPSVSSYQEIPLGPFKLTLERTLNWPEIGVSWRSTPVAASVPEDGSRLAFSYSISVKGSGQWLGRSVSVQYNYIEVELREDSGLGVIPAQRVSAGTYFQVNNLVLAVTVPVVAGAAAVAAYFLRGLALEMLGGPLPIPVH